jgi:RimJ/RimL family protein N-acetyltransferase
VDGEIAGIGGLIHSTLPLIYWRISIVQPKYRGRGFAKQLADNDVKYMREKMKRYILLGIPDIDNEASVAICLKVGYKICGTFAHCYVMICPVMIVRDKCIEMLLRFVCWLYPKPMGLPIRLFAKSKGF